MCSRNDFGKTSNSVFRNVAVLTTLTYLVFLSTESLRAQNRGLRAAPEQQAPALQDGPARVVALANDLLNGSPELEAGDLISVGTRNASLKEILRAFARAGGFNLIVQPIPDVPITMQFFDIEWELALQQILRVNGLAAEVEKGPLVAGPTLKIMRSSGSESSAPIQPPRSRNASFAGRL